MDEPFQVRAGICTWLGPTEIGAEMIEKDFAVCRALKRHFPPADPAAGLLFADRRVPHPALLLLARHR
jgi:hypothetical protein